MRYLAELYYWQDQKGFPFRQAMTVTAVTVARWSAYFYARLLAPKQGKGQERSGALAADERERESFVRELLEWIFAHSSTDEVFCLLLDDEPVPGETRAVKFGHYDDTCCWELNLSEDEFLQLQKRWVEHGLPGDLFYPESAGRWIPWPGRGLMGRLLRLAGVGKYVTPKQWEQEAGSLAEVRLQGAQPDRFAGVPCHSSDAE
jgi:hypothetical protein